VFSLNPFSENLSVADFEKLALEAYEYQKNNATFELFLSKIKVDYSQATLV